MIPYLQVSVVILSYLLGSIPFGLIIAKLAGYGDIRKIGSGNIGATNVLRTGNKKLALLTLILDGSKGAAAVLLTHALFPDEAPLAGLAALAGHLFPIWLNFKGGKGVATAVGVLTGLAWQVGVTVMLIWSMIAITSRYSSLASLLALGIAPALVVFSGHGDWMWLAVCMLMLIVGKHSGNIKRLMEGTEPKIGAEKNATAKSE